MEFQYPADNWFMMGGEEVSEEEIEEDGRTFFCQKWYDVTTARFEDIPSNCCDFQSKEGQRIFCPSCDRRKAAESVSYLLLYND